MYKIVGSDFYLSEMAIDPEIILSGLRQFKGVAGALISRARQMASPLSMIMATIR